MVARGPEPMKFYAIISSLNILKHVSPPPKTTRKIVNGSLDKYGTFLPNSSLTPKLPPSIRKVTK